MVNVVERNELIMRYMPLAKKMANQKQKSLPHIEYDEFLSAAYTGLVDAASRYEPEKCGGNFGPYARTRIYGEMQDFLRKLGFGSKGSVSRGCTQFMSIDAPQGANGETILSFMEARPSQCLEQVFEETVESLDDGGKELMRLHLVDGWNVSEISRQRGVSVSRVSQMISKCRRQLVAEAA